MANTLRSPASPLNPVPTSPLNLSPEGTPCKNSNPVKRSLASQLTKYARKRRSPKRQKWRSLGVDQSELCLDLTLPTGQSFRWKQTGESEYTGVIENYLFTLRQSTQEYGAVEYMLHNCTQGLLNYHEAVNHDSRCDDSCTIGMYKSTTNTDSDHGHGNGIDIDIDIDADTCFTAADVGTASCMVSMAEKTLRNYLTLDTSLKDVWAPFIIADARFAALAPHMSGARLLRQRPLECLFQFICSSNNHIQRISQMVDHLASFGPYLGTVKGLPFHAFPTLDVLGRVTESELRAAGFGYRAKYIVGAVKELQAKKNGGEEWLYSLRSNSLNDALEALCTLPGIGPKVAACVALFSLDQHHAIPVDTHVWQIAIQYITPELSGERLTPKLHSAVSDAFVKRFGKYAGWAQNVLFIAELASHQHYLPEHLRATREKKPKNKNMKKSKSTER